MKKLLLALPLVAGASLAGTSHYAGSQTEAEYSDLLEQLNGLNLLDFVQESYTSGLGKSEAITKVMISGDSDEDILFRLHHDIRHAPLRMDEDGVQIGTVSIDTTFHDQNELPEELKGVFSSEHPFQLQTTVGYGGAIRNNLTISGVHAEEESGGIIQWGGLSLDVLTNGDKTLGHGDVAKASVVTPDGTEVVIAGGDMDVDVQYHGDSIYSGETGIELQDISVSHPLLPAPSVVEKLSFRGVSGVDGELMNSKAIVGMTGLNAPIPLNALNLEVALAGLSVGGMREYNNVVNSYAYSPDELLANSEELLPEIMSALRGVITSDSALRYDLELANTGGKVVADMLLTVKDTDAPGMTADALDNVVTGKDLLNVIDFAARLNADTAALEQTPLLMMAAQYEDFLSINDNKIRSEVSLDGMLLRINEVEFPLDVMAGGVLDVPLADLLPK